MNLINIDELESEMTNNKVAFLCGNGFDINFDSGFSNIYERLYMTHNLLYKNTCYKVETPNRDLKRKLKFNYNSVLNKLIDVSEDVFYKLFDDGIRFAESIINCCDIYTKLKAANYISTVFKEFSNWTILNSLYEVGTSSGASKVNIEYWPILTHFYFALKLLNCDCYKMPKNNSYIELIEIGDSSEISLGVESIISQYTLFNGFNTYYKMLNILAIYNDGKSLNPSDLDRLDRLNLDTINSFIGRFKLIWTLNYDNIIENLFGKEIIHLHGQYKPDTEEYVYNQSFSILDSGHIISCSDILIGDYFTNKMMLESIINSEISKLFDDNILNGLINEVLIFGMNVDNDLYVLSNIIFAYLKAKIQAPKIIYSYYTIEEKIAFENQFETIIKNQNGLNKYARNIDVKFISTKDLLDAYFNK